MNRAPTVIPSSASSVELKAAQALNAPAACGSIEISSSI